MKTRIMAVAAGIGMGAAGWCAAQYPEDLPAGELEKQREPIVASLMLRTADVAVGHDALQHRADYDDESRRHWQNGEIAGDGKGFTLSLQQGGSELTLRRERLEHEFVAQSRDDRQEIDTRRDDWDILYWHTEEGRGDIGEKGAWGWTVGIRHISSRKTMTIRELNEEREVNGQVTYKLLQGGYWGAWRPVQWRARIFGALTFLFGEVDGLGRLGNDEKLDGKIQESYVDDQGLAYGMGFVTGVGVDVFKYVRLDLGYRREWLYSFQSTDSGVVVFPDNDDALFIENVGGLYAELGARFHF